MNFLARAAGAAALVLSLAAAAVPQMLLVPASTKAAAEKPSGVLSPASPVTFNGPEMLAMQPGEEADLVLPGGHTHRVVLEKTVFHDGLDASWVGYLKAQGKTHRVIVTRGPAGAYGVIDAPEGTLRILPGGRHDWLVDMAQEAPLLPGFPQADDALVVTNHGLPTPDPGKATFAAPETASTGTKASPAPQAVVDVLFVVTNGLAASLGNSLTTRLNFLVTRANTAYADSEIAITMRKVGQMTVNWPDDTNDRLALNSITPVCNGGVGCGGGFNSAVFGAVEGTRTSVGADVVSFMRNGSNFGGSGIAWVPVPVTAGLMYSTIQGCVASCESVFIHEVGHNMGNMHDRGTVAWQGGGVAEPLPPAQQGLQPYAYGYAFCNAGVACNPNVPPASGGCNAQPECNSPGDANNFSDIMAYFGGSTDKIYKFSNPNILCTPSSGVARPCGVANLSDTARSMNGNRLAVSAVKATTVGASIQFTASSFSGTEAGGVITFSVSRTGDSSGAVSVDYAVASGSATSGIDFTATSGTLNWAAGDAADKSFSVPITNDLATEGIESFTATLSNPVGAPSAVLGAPSAATGLIMEPWPGAFASQFNTAPGSTVGWSAAADASAPDGDNSSFGSGTLSFASGNLLCTDPVYGSVPCPSATQLVKTTNAGPVSFAYRVSSYPGNGFLEFFIDGTLMLTASGSQANADSGWQLFSTAVAAGSHTFKWQYRPVFPFPCSVARPTGSTTATYPGCLDRAWIDELSLPLVLAPSTNTLGTSANPAAAGASVTFTATIAGSVGAATGTVTFRDGSAAIPGCTNLAVSGALTASCTTAGLGGGVHSITAVYSGNTAYVPSISNAVAQVMTLGPQLLAANPVSTDFGGQSMNTTAPALTVVLTNTTGSAITVTSITAAAGFAVSSSTCTTVAPAATCQLAVTFTPGSEGQVPGSISVAYAGGGPTLIGLTGTGERSLVTHYYRSILRRAPDSGGKTFWEGEALRVQALGANVNEVWFAMAQSFYFSAEYLAQARTDAQFTTDLYNTFYNRAPDPSGFTFWTGNLAQGMPREVLLAQFMFSPEFAGFTQAIFGAANVRREVDTVVDFYRGLLSRLPDDGGFGFWVQRFRTAQCQGGAAVNAQVESISSQFALSAEYSGRARSNAQYVGDLYNSFLRRGGDGPGVQYWINQVASNAMTREQVRQQFVASPEFQARVAAVIQQGCL